MFPFSTYELQTLYIWSSFLTTASYLLFGVYCWFWLKNPAFDWMPPFCFACIIYFSCMGLLPIPYIVTIEIFPKKIRSICLALAMTCMWVILFALGMKRIWLHLIFIESIIKLKCDFASGMLLPTFLETVGLFIFMISLSAMSLLNALFGIFCIPETRGKSFEEITEMLNR